MKITTVLLLVACLQVSATGYGQRISISGQELTLKNVFVEIQKQSGFSFLYFDKDLENARKVSINVKNADLEEVLKQVFRNQPLTYTIVEKTIVVKIKEPDALNRIKLPPPIDVRGRVVNEKGIPVAGVTVSVKGTRIATATNDKGEFDLKNINEDAVLLFSGINVENSEIRVNGQSNLSTVILKTKVTTGEEITISINTGYQTISKERSAGSFSKPDMKAVAERSSSMDIIQRLDGQIPGFVINNSPSSDINPYTIRGLATLGSNRQPLIVVDGIQIDDIANINPLDVADITVLKDATSASIWGARAANGVIVITTKKGKPGEKIKVQYDAFMNFQGRPDLSYFPVLDSRQYIQTVREIFYEDSIWNYFPYGAVTGQPATSYTTGLPPHDQILYNHWLGRITDTQRDNSLDSLASINNVSQMEQLFFQPQRLMQHNLSLSGGSRIYSFRGSLNYVNTQSSRPGDNNNRYQINLRQDLNVSNRIKLFLITDVNSIHTSQKRPVVADNRFYPYQLFRDANGNNLPVNYMTSINDSIRPILENSSRLDLQFVPLDEMNYGHTKKENFVARITGGVTVKILDGLSYEGLYGYIRGNSRSTAFDDQRSYKVRYELVQFTTVGANGRPVYHLPSTGGWFAVNNSYDRNWTVRNQLVFDQGWMNRKHQVTLLAGQEAQEQLAYGYNTKVRGYDEQTGLFQRVDYNLLASSGVNPAVLPAIFPGFPNTLFENYYSENEIRTRFASYYANGGYTFNRKYTLNASVRFDESNLFGKDKSAQNRPVWSVGGKWMVTDEEFMKNNSWLDHLAVRATYGISGNSLPPGSAASVNIYQQGGGGSFYPGQFQVTLRTAGNSKLSWETTKMANLGFDFAFLKSRINGSIDLYRKNSEGLLGLLPVNPLTGQSVVSGNIGVLLNKGFEARINSVNVETKNFFWGTTLNIAYNKNTITEMNTLAVPTSVSQQFNAPYIKGMPAFALYAYDYAGLNNAGLPLVNRIGKSVTTLPDEVSIEDLKFMGTYQPKWNGGLSTTFGYKNFSITANSVFNLGHVMRRDLGGPGFGFFYYGYASGRVWHGPVNGLSESSGFVAGQIHPEFLNRWRQPGDEAFTSVPRNTHNPDLLNQMGGYGNNFYHYGDINVVSGSFWKMRDITLAYSLPKNWVSRINSDNITVRAQVSNFMIWRANKHGIDPEFHEASVGRRGVAFPFTNTFVNRNNQNTFTISIHAGF